MRRLLALSLAVLFFMLGIYLSYRCGIRHAMTESVVSVYLDGRVEIQLDGDVYEHIAF